MEKITAQCGVCGVTYEGDIPHYCYKGCGSSADFFVIIGEESEDAS